MKQFITNTEECKLYVHTTMLPGFRTVSLRCIEYNDSTETKDSIVFINRREIEDTIKALQASLDAWDEYNGLS